MASASTRNDSWLWSQFADEVRDHPGVSVHEAEMIARRLVAVVRQAALPNQPTWAPQDRAPDVYPAAVFDVDGIVWDHLDGASYRMSSADCAALAGNSEIVPVRDWEDLLAEDGPVTAHTPPTDRVGAGGE